MATTAQIDSIVALYAGYFNRAPDPAGLQFWIDQIENGREFNTIAADFAASPEAEALYPYLTAPALVTPTAFVTSIYLNLFNRSPDAAGLEFWTDALAAGTVSAADMIEAVINGARDDATATPPSFDKATLDNKVEAGLDWAQETSATVGFTYDADAAAAAVAALSGVTDDVATVAAAKAATDVFVSGADKIGSTFTLTTDADTFIGTAGQDTFQGLDFQSFVTPGTLTNFDELDGGAGVDTLNLIVRGSLTVPSGVSISNIEVINLLRSNARGTFDASVFSGATQIWQINDADDIEDLVEGQTAGFRNTDVSTGDDIEYRDGAVTASVALDNADNNIELDINGGDIETVNIAGTQAGPGSADLDVDLGTDGNGADAVTALNISLSTDTVLVVGGSNGLELKTVDASGSTGGITYELMSANSDDYALESITGGTGNDDLTINDLGNLSADTFAVSGGAGNDIMEIVTTANGTTAVSVTVTGGEGNDTLKLGDLLNVTDSSEANFMDSLITFADFNGDEDVIDINGFLTGLSNVELANIAAADDLFAAVGLASTAAGTNNIVAFDFGDNAYIYENDNTLGFTSGDGLVQVTGVSSNDFDSSNVIFNGVG